MISTSKTDLCVADVSASSTERGGAAPTVELIDAKLATGATLAMDIRLPTRVRFMSAPEYRIVSRVFGDTLPYRVRILITNAAGVDGRPFTVPTSLLSTVVGMNPVTFLSNLTLGYLASFVNVAYLINVGADYGALDGSSKDVLVHETAHVWQGKNSVFALSYVFNSVYNQCVRANAYAYSPGQAWSSYNVEQQASIVEDWFMSGEPPSGNLYPYIVNHVRTGDA